MADPTKWDKFKQGLSNNKELLGGMAGMASSIGASEANPNGLFDMADPLHYLADGKTSEAGSIMGQAGVGLFQAGAQSGNPWLMLAGGATKALGSLTDAAFGMKTDEKALQEANSGTDYLNSYKGGAESFDELQGLKTMNDVGKVYEGGWFTQGKARRKNRALQQARAEAESRATANLNNNIDNLMQAQSEAFNSTYAAFGGPLHTNGADWSNGLITINNGGTHEANPNEGVPMGMAPDGLPNLVEEGEVIYNDYVFSNRLKVPKSVIKKYKLKGKEGMTFADAIKSIQKESEERPNDPISKRGLDDWASKLTEEQEIVRNKQAQRKAMRDIKNQAASLGVDPNSLMAMSQQGLVAPNQMMYSYGGNLFGNGGHKFGGNNPYIISSGDVITDPALANILGQKGSRLSTHSMDSDYTLVDAKGKQYNVPFNKVDTTRLHSTSGGKWSAGQTFTVGAAPKRTFKYIDPNDNRAWRPPEVMKFPTEAERLAYTNDYNNWKVNRTPDQLEGWKDYYNEDGSPKNTYANGGHKFPDGGRPYNINTDDYTFSDWRTLWDNQEYSPSNQQPPNIPYIKDMKQEDIDKMRAMPSYQAWTKYVNDNWDTDNVQSYLKELDKQTGGNHLFDTNGNILPEAKDYFNKARTTGPYGLYSETPGYMPAIQGDDPLTANIKEAAKRSSSETGPLTENLSLMQEANKYVVPPEYDPEDQNRNKNKNKNNKNYLSYLRYAPVAAAGLGVITDALGLTNKPDYTYADKIEALNDEIKSRNVDYKPIGDYMAYRPLDRLFYANQLAAQANTTRGNIMNTSGGNRGTAMAGLLAADYNAQKGLGQLYRQGEEYNLAQREKVDAFNRGTNMFNSQQDLRAQLANASQGSHNMALRLDALTKAAALRNAADNLAGASRSANLTNLVQGLGDIGREAFEKQMVNKNNAYYYEIGSDGTPRYKNDELKELSKEKQDEIKQQAQQEAAERQKKANRKKSKKESNSRACGGYLTINKRR